MFGYVVVNEPELKIREYDTYRSYYCGLCQGLKKSYGKRGQLAVNYDLTMVYLLLTSLYEPESVRKTKRCGFHCFKKVQATENRFSEYVADMSLLLGYGKAVDDWNDEKKLRGLTYKTLIKGDIEKIKAKYPAKTEAVFKGLDKIAELEQQNEENLDVIGGAFGEVFSEILDYRADEWQGTLREIGFYLGKFIYLCDAYEDLEDDLKKGCYNPLKNRSTSPYFEEDMFSILTLTMASCAEAFEFLPLIEDVEILRNIIYSGVWSRYSLAKKKRLGAEGAKDESNQSQPLLNKEEWSNKNE